jgi:hypothetical protein
MSEIKTGTTRASMLKRLALLVGGGAVGAGVAARSMGGGSAAPVPAPASAGRRTQELTLRGLDWRLARPGVEHGKLPTAADVAVPVGRIVDVDQNELGRFRAAALPGLAAFHLHTFDLAEGTILGLGANRLDEGSYAIVGGTGLYAGATGTYLARQSPRELGGDGTAEFTLTLIALEA